MSELIPVDYEEILKETDLAWLLLLDSSDPWNQTKEWFPRSCCEIDEKEQIISIPEWLAIEKELV